MRKERHGCIHIRCIPLFGNTRTTERGGSVSNPPKDAATSCALFAILAIMASFCFGQVETSTSVRGLVTDPSGASIVGAKVTIKNEGTNEERVTTTNDTGFYAFPSVLPGTYDVTVIHPGFKRAQITGRVAEASQSAQVDVVLEVGQNTESVTVSAAGAELISTTTAEIGGIVPPQLLEEMPTNGRNFFDLATLLPQVSLQNLGPQMSFAGFSNNVVYGSSQANPTFRSSGIFAAGNRDSAANVSVDGVNIQSSVYRQAAPEEPPSAIEELKIHVSSMDAEFGNGAAAVNVITKSGTNAFHGEAYDYLQNSALDANFFFSNAIGHSVSPFRENQFGGAVGGPIKHDKLFFFGAYEGLRIRQSSYTFVTPPPVEIRGGDFSNFHPPGSNGTFLPTPTIYNPYAYDPNTGLRQPFPGNTIPASLLDPVTLAFLRKYVEVPNSTLNGQEIYAGNQRQVLNSDQEIARIDYSQSESSRIYGRYSKMTAPSTLFSVESLAGTSQNSRDQNAGIHWTKVFSPTTVNDVMIGYARPYWLYSKDNSLPNVSALIGLMNTSSLGGGPSFSNGYSMNATQLFYLEGTDNLYQFSDNFTHVAGRHSLKAGFQLMQRRFYYPTQSDDKGQFSFTSTFTAACPDGNSACTAAMNAAGLTLGGNAFASYLLGTPISGLFQLTPSPYRGYQWYYAGFLQDSWRVNGRLTLNYGLRYEYWAPWFLPRHTVASFNQTTGQIEYVLQNPLDYLNPSTNYGRNAPLNPNLPDTGYKTGNKNIAPRIGVAYAIRPSTVFRVAYGIYYDGNSNTNQFSNIESGVGPFQLRYQPQLSSSQQVPSVRVAGQFPFPSPTTVPQPNSSPLAAFRFVPGYYPASQVQEWSASIEQRLGSNWALDLSYQGTHVIHLPQFIDVNPPALPQGALANVPIDQRRIFPQWGVIGTWAPIGYGRYNGVSATVRNNLWHGLVYLSSFTFAKNIVSGYLGTSDQGNQDGQYPYIWQGPARITPKFRAENSLNYQLPFGKGKSFATGGVPAAILGSWTISAIADMTTGSPDWVTTVDTSGTGYGAMPNRICNAMNVPGGRSYHEWFNTACFTQPAFGTWGNSNEGVVTDPGIESWNISVQKSIRMARPETARLDFRADFFNAFNHTQWGASNDVTLTSSPTAGQISSTRPPRQIQLSLRYVF